MRPVVFDGVDLLGMQRPENAVELAGSLDAWRARHFAAVCMGEAALVLPGLRPSGGALSAAVHLARHGVRAGLVAAIEDDARGRAVLADVKDAGVDVDGVALLPPRGRILTASARRVVPLSGDEQASLSIPEGWTYELLLISGLPSALLPAAAMCRAARAAHRSGACVVVDVNARRSVWKGQDPRQIHAILREADVVHCSTDDLVSLWTDSTSLRAAMRPTATFVATDGAGEAVASGTFGEVVVAPREVLRSTVPGAGDAFTAAVCRELLRAEAHVDWERVLHRGHAAAHERIRAELG